MRSKDGGDDREPEARTSASASPGRIGAVETLKHASSIRIGDTGTVISDFDDRIAPDSSQGDLNRRAFRRVADNIANRIREDLGDTVTVGAHHHSHGRAMPIEGAQAHRPRRVQGLQVENRVIRQFHEIQVRELQGASFVQPRQRQQILDKGRHSFRFGLNTPHDLLDALRRDAAHRIEFAIPGNRGEWSAELM